ncbi:eukaryotic cytochrome b561-domain-containing protein [Phialemonium atrogriseum]|uniref:Eukaryotic cytochrome b561-domain-containing protein n=1 Tax=Phialemonium atrogriseum TaxID=1093897 RepID=A0AAJ0CBT4_9PEZI|nr:eukaryotic cytochrome b561-domain-containing protein [Phialemonium atrogriseum]KAK1772593.1 eukaryotic cytochrome b561-domain-containing protein [Phialemonium atrogriseum]
MASATGIPQRIPDADTGAAETEPLLGRAGDAAQKQGAPLISNLWLGTGWIAQAGALLLLAVVWAGVFLNPLLPLVSPHPLLQSLGVFTITQAILILQPTRTAEGKLVGARAHAALNLVSFLLLASGIAVIETNKGTDRAAHFHSPHAYLGVVTGALLLLQYLFGFLIWAVPAVLGGDAAARSLWRYHRWSGYAVYLLLLATVATATRTPYSENVLGIKLWSVLVASALVVVGVFPRISVTKLGLRRSQ